MCGHEPAPEWSENDCPTTGTYTTNDVESTAQHAILADIQSAPDGECKRRRRFRSRGSRRHRASTRRRRYVA